MDECTPLLLQLKGAGGPRGEKSELAETNQQSGETRNDLDIIYQIHSINVLPAAIFDAIPRC